MNEALLVEYDPFSMESRVSIFKEHMRDYARVCSSIEELTAELIAMAYENEIYNIKIRGPFAIMSQLDRMIKQYELNQYSENKITVEGF